MPKNQKIEDVPMIENYPPLKEWLFSERLNARCLWQLSDEYSDSTAERMRVEAWAINGRVVVFTLYADRKGFEIYTNADTNNIEASIRDAEARIGLAPDFAKVEQNIAAEDRAQRELNEILDRACTTEDAGEFILDLIKRAEKRTK